MRRVLIIFSAFAALWGVAAADHRDPQLDALFEELRQGPAEDADGTIRRIMAIWADSDSDTVDLLYARAVQCVTDNDWALATALLDHAIGLSPNFAQAYVLRGVARNGGEDTNGASHDFLKSIELEPRHFAARMYLAEIAYRDGDKMAAYDMYQEVLRWNPHEPLAVERARALRDAMDRQDI